MVFGSSEALCNRRLIIKTSIHAPIHWTLAYSPCRRAGYDSVEGYRHVIICLFVFSLILFHSFPDSIPLLFDGENAGELKCSNISTFPKIEYGDSSRPIEGISTYFSHSLHGQDVENNMWANYCIGKFTAAMKGITIDLGSSLALRFVVSVNE